MVENRNQTLALLSHALCSSCSISEPLITSCLLVQFLFKACPSPPCTVEHVIKAPSIRQTPGLALSIIPIHPLHVNVVLVSVLNRKDTRGYISLSSFHFYIDSGSEISPARCLINLPFNLPADSVGFPGGKLQQEDHFATAGIFTQEMWDQSLDRQDPLRRKRNPLQHSCQHSMDRGACRLWPLGSQRVRHDS